MFSDDDDVASDSSAARKRKSKAIGTSSSARKTGAANLDTANLSAKARLKAEFNPNHAQQLNVNKRDTRSIEEIEADLRRKKELAHGNSSNAESKAQQGFFAGRKNGAVPPSTVASKPYSAAPPGIAPIKRKERASNSPPIKSKPAAADRRPAKARASSYSPPPKAGASLKEEIWSIINPNKTFASRRTRDYDSDAVDDDSDNMEAGYDEIEEENMQADKIARREDRRELERLEKQAREKEIRKRKNAGR